MLRLPLLAAAFILPLNVSAAEGEWAQFRDWIEAHVQQEPFKLATWGIKIAEADSGETIYERNAEKLLKPASNNKLFTGALILDRLGPEGAIDTDFLTNGELVGDGTLMGDLLVHGRGSPTFGARHYKWDYARSLDPAVKAVQKAGIKRITGDIIGDESYFRGAPFGGGWTWDDLQYYYGAQVSALTVDDNVIDLQIHPGEAVGEPCRIVPMPGSHAMEFINLTKTVPSAGRRSIDIDRPVGSAKVLVSGTLPLGDPSWTAAATVADPPLWFALLLRERLIAEGIVVEGKAESHTMLDERVDPIGRAGWQPLFTVPSKPLKEMLPMMMQPSQNLYAQLFLLHVGERAERERAEPRHGGSESAGLSELRRFLTDTGVERGAIQLEEGSGLGRGALITPAAIIKLLRHMDRHEHRETWLASLPVAGESGTLRRRMRGTAAEGNCQAKTGTLRHVRALSGYVTTADGQRLVFSILLNAHPGSSSEGRNAIDEIVVKLAEHREEE